MADAKLKAIITVANKASGPLKAINSDLNKIRSPIRNLSRQFKGLDRSSGFKELRKGVSGLAGQMAKLGVVGVGAAGALFAAVNKVSQTGDEIIKTATNFDISTDALQEWRFVAERSGVSTAAMTKSMQAFTKRLSEARNGSGELHGLLSKVNPEFLKQILAVDNNTDAYALMINTMAKLPDQQRQILLGDKAFSEAGRELVKITALGSDEIDKLKKSAHDYGAVLDEKTLKKSAEFQDEMTNVTSMAKGLTFAVGSELMPEIKSLLVEVREWYLLNKDVIKVNVAEFAKKAAAGIRGLATWVKAIAPDVLKFVDSIGGFKTVAIGLGLVLAGPLLSAVVALGAALLATPMGLMITGVAALALGAKYLYDNFEPVKNLFDSTWRVLGLLIKAFVKIGSLVGGGLISSLSKVVSMGSSFFGGDNSQQRPAASVGSSFFGGDDSQQRPADASKKLVNAANGLRPESNVIPFSKGRAGNERGYTVKPFKQSVLSAKTQKPAEADVSGKIHVVIDSSGSHRVKTIKSENPRVAFDVDAGMSFGHG